MVMKSFVTFSLEEQFYGLDITLVREINSHMDITPAQQAPHFVKGLVNLRGQIVTILDLGKRFGLDPHAPGDLSRNVILKTENELEPIRFNTGRDDLVGPKDPVALLIHELGDVLEIEEDEIHPVPANLSRVENKYLAGVIKRDGDLVVLISPETLYSVE